MNPDPFVLALSRLQFGFTIGFHYIFVPLTLGLAVAIAAMDTLRVTSGRHEWRRSARFWNRFFVLAWLMGMATGYPLRMQLERQWSGYHEHARQVLRAIMGVEGLILPVMVGLVVLLAFAAHVLPPLVRAGARWLLATILLVQAACIVTLNAWMQQPVGTRVGVNGAEIVDLQAIFLSETALCKVAHTLSAGLLTGTLFVVSVSAFYLLRRRHLAVARFSLALTLPMAGLALVATVWSGHSSGRQVMAQQPMKFAAMEAHWGEHEGPAPLTLLAVPDMSSQTNRYALAVPKLLSWLATHSEESPRGMRELVARAEQQIGAALQEPHGPEGTGWRQLYERTAQRHEAWTSLTDAQRLHAAALASRPSVPTLFVSFRVMVGCAVVLGFAIASALLTQRRRLLKGGNRAELRLLMVCLPLPWLATFAGWTLAEVGRQPWIIYEQMTTARAAVALPGTAQAVGQLMAFVVIYALLGMLFSLAARWLLLRGPERRVWPAPWRERALGFVTSVMSRSGAQRLLARASADTVMRR